MKKIIYLFLCLFLICTSAILSSCSKNEDDIFEDQIIDFDSKNTYFNVEKVYPITKRRTMLFYAYPMYVLKLVHPDNGKTFYKHVLRFNIGQDIKPEDKISFKIYRQVPDEIAEINGQKIGIPKEEQTLDHKDNSTHNSSLVASDPIETTVCNIFYQNMVYGIPFVTLKTVCIETSNGILITVKQSKLNSELKIGDLIVYNTYTLFPNEVLAIKKLR